MKIAGVIKRLGVMIGSNSNALFALTVPLAKKPKSLAASVMMSASISQFPGEPPYPVEPAPGPADMSIAPAFAAVVADR